MIRVIDFETTDMPPEADVIEYGLVNVNPDTLEPAGWADGLVKTERPISIGALATHHITPDMLEGGCSWEEAKVVLGRGSPDYYCAHNAEFEKAFYAPDAPWIDTYKVALRLWPDAPSHSNQGLRYFLNLKTGPEAMPPHRALPDCWVTADILIRMLQKIDLPTLRQWSDEPYVLPRITFGKHRGAAFKDVPRDYLGWLIRQPDMRQDVKDTAKMILEGRV